MANTFDFILWIILSIACFVLYHKLFDVLYLSGKAFTRELVGCMLAGGGLLALLYKFWWVVVIIGVLVCLALYKNGSDKKIVPIVAVFFSIVGLIFGGIAISGNSHGRARKSQSVQTQAVEFQQPANSVQQETTQTEREQAQINDEQTQDEETDFTDTHAQGNMITDAIADTFDSNHNATSNGYIFPSDRQYISESDMVLWDQTTALLARNEIYARHGYIFETESIQNYFSAQDWYSPNPSYEGAGLSKVEQSNVNIILAYEQEMGWQ